MPARAFRRAYAWHAAIDGRLAAAADRLRAFYELMGWDAATGVPDRTKLASLGLDWIAA